MFQIYLRMTAPRRRAIQAVSALLRFITTRARAEPGYLSSRTYQDVEDPEALCLEEHWSTETALKSHLPFEQFHTAIDANRNCS